ARLAPLADVAALGLGIAAAVRLASRHPVGNPGVPQPRKPVDLSKYLGRWHELARYEQRYQKGCDGVTADYTLRADGDIQVTNRCRRDDGAMSEAIGHAKVVDTTTRAKLKVSFFGPFYGDYWVLDHADDYAWAIVGEPSGRCLWILSREATPPEDEIARLYDRARELGYDTTLLRRTQQP